MFVSLCCKASFHYPTLDTAAFISLFAYAFAIPTLTCNILVNLRRGTGTKTPIHEILFLQPGDYRISYWYSFYVFAYLLDSLCDIFSQYIYFLFRLLYLGS